MAKKEKQDKSKKEAVDQEKETVDLTNEEKLELDLKDQKDKYLRLFAEFDNYKKRTSKERLELSKTAAKDVLLALLPVLDDFDRAKTEAEKEDSEEQFSEGVSLVYQKLYQKLSGLGLEKMEVVQEFDPEIHEAITEIPAPSDDMKGKIIDYLEKGYTLHDSIIRHAKVVVGK